MDLWVWLNGDGDMSFSRSEPDTDVETGADEDAEDSVSKKDVEGLRKLGFTPVAPPIAKFVKKYQMTFRKARKGDKKTIFYVDKGGNAGLSFTKAGKPFVSFCSVALEDELEVTGLKDSDTAPIELAMTLKGGKLC